MKKNVVVGPDQKPSPEKLLEMYEKLDGQVAEIKRQYKRGVLNGRHVQALIEHRNPFAGQTAKAKNGDIVSQLFDSQLQRLEERGCPARIIAQLRSQRDEVLAKASQVDIAKGNLVFLPVVPLAVLDPYKLMPMVRYRNQTGYVFSGLDISRIRDLVVTPTDPYYIYDVEDGTATKGQSPLQAEKTVKKENRRCLTVPEDISLTILTEVLTRHNVWAAGSRYGSDYVPFVWLDGDGPELYYNSAVYSDWRWGSPSCGSV